MSTLTPWRLEKCNCGDSVCRQYKIAGAQGSGAFEPADAVLIVNAREMFAALKAIASHKNASTGKASMPACIARGALNVIKADRDRLYGPHPKLTDDEIELAKALGAAINSAEATAHPAVRSGIATALEIAADGTRDPQLFKVTAGLGW